MDVRGAGGHVDGQADTRWEGPLPAAPRPVGRREGGVALKGHVFRTGRWSTERAYSLRTPCCFCRSTCLQTCQLWGLHPAAPQE